MNGVDPVEKRGLARRREAPVTSEEEKNMALVRRFQQAEAKGDLDMLDELLAPEFVDHSLLEGQEPGRERATSASWPSNMLPSLTFAASSRTS
jgi:hypothetical protein